MLMWVIIWLSYGMKWLIKCSVCVLLLIVMMGWLCSMLLIIVCVMVFGFRLCIWYSFVVCLCSCVLFCVLVFV